MLIGGIILIWGDMDGWLSTQQNLWLNVGCSLMASAIVILATALLIERNPNSLLQEWGLSAIYAKRNAKERDSYEDLKRTKERIDIIAFGLRTFRSDKKNIAEIERYLSDGGSIRILTMDPKSKFIEQRETEEKSAKDHIRQSITDLVRWATELNGKSSHGKIIVKGYDCMTLDFYWRLDDVLYVGSYPYGCESDQAPTYKYTKGGKGFELYSDYFKSLWDNQNFKELTQTSHT